MRECSLGLGFRVSDKVRVSVRDRVGVSVSLIGLIIPTCRANLVLRVI